VVARGGVEERPMFSSWFGGDKAEGNAAPSAGSVFHEYPHPDNWSQIVDELYSRFGADGEQIPLDMCPCGERKPTVRRFLVARKYKVDEAEKMIRDTMVWRQTVAVGDVRGIDAILAGKPRWDLLHDNRRIIPASPFHCYAKQGYPVYMLRLGKGDGALATTAPEECHVYCSIVRGEHLSKIVVPEATKRYKAAGGRRGQEERMQAAAAAAGGGKVNGVAATAAPAPPAGTDAAAAAANLNDPLDLMDKQVVIVDLEGIGMSALRCLWVFKTINSVAGYNYPELSKAIYILNSPSVFEYLWSAIKPLLAAHTQSKIRIFQTGPEQYKALQLILEDDDIPDYLTPQPPGQGSPKGHVGSVTDCERPDHRPEGVLALDTWVVSQSAHPDKACPFK